MKMKEKENVLKIMITCNENEKANNSMAEALQMWLSRKSYWVQTRAAHKVTRGNTTDTRVHEEGYGLYTSCV